MRDLKDLVRPNIWRMHPYSSARSEFDGWASIFLDANENPFDRSYNRYPDPLQRELKARLVELMRVPEENIFLGNGSDEAIDLLMRAFCEPGKDNIVSISPSYGMYEVAAEVNDVACVKVPLTEDYALDADALLASVGPRTKLIFLCSPNNPTGNLLDYVAVKRVLDTFEGIVVVDEAYIDFAAQESWSLELAWHPNLVVLHTLSKAWGGAGVRLGMAFASKEIIAILNKIKYPYNVSQPAMEKAMELLKDPVRKLREVSLLIEERERMREVLSGAPFFYDVYPSDANFLLVRVGDGATALYEELLEHNIVVRNRTNVALCEGCLRITVGTPEENDTLLNTLLEL